MVDDTSDFTKQYKTADRSLGDETFDLTLALFFQVSVSMI
jgi:hypothetical protein